MLSLFSFQALEKLDLEVLDFWLFTELSILEWFSTWFFKHARIPVRTYFQSSDRVHGRVLQCDILSRSRLRHPAYNENDGRQHLHGVRQVPRHNVERPLRLLRRVQEMRYENGDRG